MAQVVLSSLPQESGAALFLSVQLALLWYNVGKTWERAFGKPFP
jgi:hypothetical protein